jgi:hypothetical protein
MQKTIITGWHLAHTKNVALKRVDGRFDNFLPGFIYWVARARIAVGDFLAQPWGWAKGGSRGSGGGELQWMSTEQLMRHCAKLTPRGAVAAAGPYTDERERETLSRV